MGGRSTILRINGESGRDSKGEEGMSTDTRHYCRPYSDTEREVVQVTYDEELQPTERVVGRYNIEEIDE